MNEFLTDWIPNPTPGKRPLPKKVKCVIKFGEGGYLENMNPRPASGWGWGIITHYKIVSLR